MKIFSGVAFDAGHNTIREAVAAIVQRAQNLELMNARWSLVELASDAEDFNWLCKWAQHLSPYTVNIYLINGQWQQFDTAIGKFSFTSGFGVLLLMFAVEVARRNANERSLWVAISQYSFSPYIQRVLFYNNYPTRVYKDTIELAVRRLYLRHVFGIEGLQNWYDSIYLQLGFTKRGFSSRLPEWLVGQNSTFAIQKLLDEGQMHSDTFQDLWTSLVMYRRKNISEQQIYRKLQHSVWILPEWIPEIMVQARAKLHLADNTRLDYFTPPTTQEAQDEPFLTQPRLVWDPFGEPKFSCHLINLAQFDLTEPTYSIVIADRIYGHLQRQTDGLYKPYPSEEITIPATTPLSVANIIASDGNVVQTQTLQLWDANEDISLFTYTTNRSLDPWQRILQTEQSYYLILAADLEIRPQPKYYYSLNKHTRLYLLEKDWPAQTQVFLEDNVLWQPRLSSHPRSSEPIKKDAIQIHLYDTSVPLAFDHPIRFRIDHPQDYHITFIRSAGHSIDFDQYDNASVITQPIIAQPHMFSSQINPGIELMLWIRHTSAPIATRLRYIIEVPIIGAALLSPDGWTAIDANQSLNLEQTKRQLMRFYLTNAEDWTLLEGDTWIANAWKTPRLLHACTGFGAALKIQKSAYNASALDRPQKIVREIINTGCVRTIYIEGNEDEDDNDALQARTLHIQLTLAIEADDQHSVVWWNQDGAYTIFKPGHKKDHSGMMEWSVTLPASCTHPVAIAITYNGTWLGSWYSEDWSEVLNTTTIEPEVIAALLRWFHLPLLGQHNFQDVVHFAYRYAIATLSIWLDENCALSNFQFASSDEGWLSTVRKVFFDWQPEQNNAELIERLSSSLPSNHPLDAIDQMVWRVSRVNPILMARILYAWIENDCIPQWGKQQATVLVKHLLSNIAEISDTTTYSKKMQQLLQELSQTMDVDVQFIQKALLERSTRNMKGLPISAIDQENLAVAMQVEPFRRLLSIHLLEFIQKQLEGSLSNHSRNKK